MVEYFLNFINWFNNGYLKDIMLLNNSLRSWIIALLFLLLFLLAFAIFRKFLLNWLEKIARETENEFDDTIISIIKKIPWKFYVFLSFYFSLSFLVINKIIILILFAILLLWAIALSVMAFEILVSYFISKKCELEKDSSTLTAVKILTILAKAGIWTLGIILVLSNLGINVSSLLAGLGIGGIAVALAVQNILGDLFSSFVILFDKPFAIGDFIIVGDKSGVVEYIGLKTTRIRALEGEQIIISNKELVAAKIHNYKRLKKRRVKFTFGVTYETDLKKLKQIPSLVEKIFAQYENLSLYSVHFKEFGDSSLVFSVVYYIKSSDFKEHLEYRQQILFRIKEVFDKQGISFAYPTYTVFLHK